MNCINHPEAPVVAYCRSCGKPLCVECRRISSGTVYCDEHAPAASPYTDPAAPLPAPTSGSGRHSIPGLAFLLGLIPGVGAIYNGQYAKGLIHAVVFGLLMSINQNRAYHNYEPLFVMMTVVWFAYMALEAYHTARKKRDGEPVDEFSSLIDFQSAGAHGSRFPLGAVVLIGLGGILLLETTDILPMDQLLRFWPIGLILIGVYMLYGRMDASRNAPPLPPPAQEVHDERR